MNKHIRTVGLYGLIISLLFQSTAIADVQPVQNVRMTAKDSYLEIKYDLLPAAENGRYTVTLEISDDGGRSYSVQPRIITGDIGKDITPGYNKRIVWRVEHRFPGHEIDLARYDVRFNIKRQGFNRNILFVIAGAVVAGGGALTYLLLGGGDDEPGFPLPPGRPQN